MSDADKARAWRAARAEELSRRTRLLADTRAEILRLLQLAADRIGLRLAQQPSEIERWVLADLQFEIRQMMGEFQDAAAARLSTVAGEAFQAGQALVDAPLAAGGIQISAQLPLLDTTQLTALRAFMTDRIKDVGLAAANQLNTELGLVVLGAQPVAAAVSRVAEILRGAPRARAITITRTELARVYATATQARMNQATDIVPGLKKQWRRSGKLHSRPNHDQADGQVQEVGKPFKLGNGVTLMHPHDPAAPASETINCGCVSLPWMQGWSMAAPGRKPYSAAELEAKLNK